MESLDSTQSEADARLRAIVETAVDGIMTIDETGTVLTVNPAIETMFGYTADALIGQSITVLMTAPDRAHLSGRLRTYLRAGRRAGGVGREVEVLRRDGSAFRVHVALGEFRLNGCSYFTCIVRDMSARFRAEVLFRNTVESAPMAMVMIDESGRMVMVNAEAERMFGCTRDELLGQPIEKLVPERMRGEHPAMRRTFRDSPSARRMGAGRDLYAVRADGTEFPVEIGLNPVETEDGLFVLSAIVDITDRKQLENKLKAANRDLETLLYVASHDMREPLRAIRNFADLLSADDNGDAATRREHVERIRRASGRMTRLIDDVLLLSRARRVEMPVAAVPADRLVQDALDRLRDRVRETGAVVRVAEDLPNLTVHRFWATEAVFNLIANALKFTMPGAAPDVAVAATPEGHGLIVSDRGPGVPEKSRERIFELFQRGVGRSVEGTGAGLAIVAQVAARHHGRAWVAPRDGGGSHFCITFGTGGGQA